MRIALYMPAAAILTVALAGCNQNGELSRGDAAEAISKRLNEVGPETKPLAMNESQFGAGVSQGYWDLAGVLTPKGQEFFSSVKVNGSDIRLYLRGQHEYEIEVTGVRQNSADATTATAEFKVSNENVTGVARRFVLTGGVGEATFQRFDDGWRLQDVSSLTYPVATNGVGGELTLSASEEQAAEQEAADQQTEIQRRTDEAREQLRLAATPTVSRAFECTISRPGYPSTHYKATVTDVNIAFERQGNVPDSRTFEFQSVLMIRRAEDYGNQYEGKLRWGENRGWQEYGFFSGCPISNIENVVSFAGQKIAAWHSRWDGVLGDAMRDAHYDENGH